MKAYFKYFPLVALMFATALITAQTAKLKTVEKEFNDYSYVKSSELLLDLVNKGYGSQDVYEKLANSYYYNNKMEDASKWYNTLFSLTEDTDPENYYRYAMALKGTENYKEADNWMTKFYYKNPSDSRGKAFISNRDYLERIDNISDYDVDLKNLELNTIYSDFGVAEFDGDIVFASSRGAGEIYDWNEQPYLNLYKASGTDDATLFSDKVNTKYHESSVAFTQDEKTMYFTRNNYYKKRRKKDKDGIVRLQLYRATLSDDGNWDNIMPVHFNSADYSVAHPAINLDGTRLYFASDMPGTLGQSDIFYADINSDGSLGDPVNLGETINTEGQESFPFVNTNGDLFYSTNGLPGLGGYDVFVSYDLDKKVSQSTTKYVSENLGKPINSSADDFAYYENLATKNGYFSSNREGGKGDDDIYSFKVLEPKQELSFTLKDNETGEILPNAVVVVMDKDGNEIARETADDQGNISLYLRSDEDYIIRLESDNYVSDNKNVTAPSFKPKKPEDKPLPKPVNTCAELAELWNVESIYFDYDEFSIRYNSEDDLNKIIELMEKYPSLEIEIRSHTDCRGTIAYNKRLSQERANATRKYLINKGVSEKRLSAKGYGESELLNSCECEPGNKSSCTEEEHEKNRRSQFVVTSFKDQNCIKD